MGILGRLFGTEKAISDITDKDVGLLVRMAGFANDLHDSDAEKAENRLKLFEFNIRQLEALAPFKVVQRILAFAISTTWAICVFSVLAAIFAEGIVNMPVITMVDGVETITQNQLNLSAPLLRFVLSDFVSWPMIACTMLYFGGGAVESWKRKQG